eukprot:TRINITY_DN2162_c0_g1_i1.p1 TRINITY_DN2162_c0_g1~~TRINITY_DN2162_c0_g1_i1.p1  ORF type:complete len:282 (+),score=104.40 TRINITY_DN2162_c0_g1_i1:107-847(+)
MSSSSSSTTSSSTSTSTSISLTISLLIILLLSFLSAASPPSPSPNLDKSLEAILAEMKHIPLPDHATDLSNLPRESSGSEGSSPGSESGGRGGGVFDLKGMLSKVLGESGDLDRFIKETDVSLEDLQQNIQGGKSQEIKELVLLEKKMEEQIQGGTQEELLASLGDLQNLQNHYNENEREKSDKRQDGFEFDKELQSHLDEMKRFSESFQDQFEKLRAGGGDGLLGNFKMFGSLANLGEEEGNEEL